MKRTNALSIVLAAAFVGAVPVAAIAQGVAKSAVPPLDFQAKVQYCKTCHGLSGQGFHGVIPIPRLAGQQPEYFENQLGAFLERRREKSGRDSGIAPHIAHYAGLCGLRITARS